MTHLTDTPELSPAEWQDLLDLEYTPSDYQARIFDFVASGKGNGMCVAVAGAGKSTSLAAVAELAEGRVLALAFNREAKDALIEKLDGTGARVKTVHGHGFAALGFTFGWGNVKVEENKYRDLVDHHIAEFDAAQTLAGDDCTPDEIKAILDEGYPRAAILKLLELARLGLLNASANTFGADLRAIATHHNIDVDPTLGGLVTDVVRIAMKWGANNPRIVDFPDMVWLPVVLRLRPWTADLILVDEAQDISKAHRALIGASLGRGGRALFVGDPRQAIYGFAGADADSFQAIIDEFECTTLPLSVCYRCPTSVLDLARELCPQIEARAGAPEGVVRNSTVDAFIDDARRRDMVLCRLNAPLMGIAFKLIAAGTSAAVRGRGDLGKGLAKTIDLATKGRRFADLGLGLDAWEEREGDIARKRYGKREDALLSRLEAIGDQAECIRVIWGASGATSAIELKAAIMRLFDTPDPKVVLSSVHRAKGLEAPRVFIAKPERLGVAWPDSRPWMIEQEENLQYVAYTRAQSELVFLDGAAPKPAGDDDDTDEVCEDCNKPQPNVGAWKDDRGQRRICGPCKALHWVAAGGPAKIKAELESLPSPGLAPLPPVDADAPDAYDPHSRAARVALARRVDAALREAGFAPTIAFSREVVYARAAADGMEIKVYSTIEGDEVRAVGKDSIKVALVQNGRGRGKAKRVNRTGKIEAIVERVLGRIQKFAPATKE